MQSVSTTASMLRAADVLWNARAFDVDVRNLPAGWMQGRCMIAADEIDRAHAVAGVSPGLWTGPIHPFQTTTDGEPIHTAQAIVDHTHEIMMRATDEVVLALPNSRGDALLHLEAARAALVDVLAENW
jgi:hypothetical protein